MFCTCMRQSDDFPAEQSTLVYSSMRYKQTGPVLLTSKHEKPDGETVVVVNIPGDKPGLQTTKHPGDSGR